MSLGSVSARNLSLSACYGSSHSSAWPATLYLALFDGNPTGSGSELTSGVGAYGRLSISNDSTSFAAPSGGSVSNAIAWSMVAATGPYSSSFTHWGFYDLSSGGTLLDCGPIVGSDGVTPISVGPLSSGDQVIFQIGAVVITA